MTRRHGPDGLGRHSKNPDQVIADRIDLASSRPHPHLPGGRLADDALLSNPRPQGTHAQRQRDEKAEAERQRDASRWVARMTMLRAHGCKGMRCHKLAHLSGREARDDLLAMLGLREAA